LKEFSIQFFRVTSAPLENLNVITQEEANKEGFLDLTSWYSTKHSTRCIGD
jgi:hypothetical protein